MRNRWRGPRALIKSLKKRLELILRAVTRAALIFLYRMLIAVIAHLQLGLLKLLRDRVTSDTHSVTVTVSV